MPPDFLQPLLHSLEGVTLRVFQEFPKIDDNDVEWVYDKLMNFYKLRISNDNAAEPLSSIERRQVLIDELLNIIDVREETEADSPNISNPSVTSGGKMIPSLEMLYVTAFKTLRNSARFWRKKDGKIGYLTYISKFLDIF